MHQRRSVDLVNSNSFLEHVEDLDGVLGELARVTPRGAFCIHGIDGIDGADHQHYVDSSIHRLQFLHEPGPGMHLNSNRIRPLEYGPIFEQHGFSVQEIIPLRKIELTDEHIAGFASPWCSMSRDLLEVVSATIVTRRL
ncbi:MAG: hypothetical protein ACJAUC_004150 [Planctomycetota bacterium]|jgi:hypothetical protein